MNQKVVDRHENVPPFSGESAFHGQGQIDRSTRNPFYNRAFLSHELSDTEVEEEAPSPESPNTSKEPKPVRKQTARFDEDVLAEQEKDRADRSQKRRTQSRPLSTIAGQANRGSTLFSKRFSMQPQRTSELHHDRRSYMPKAQENPNENENIIGEEPGVDTENMTVDLPDSCGSQVMIIDYSPDDYEILHYDVQKDGFSMVSGSSDPEALRRNLRDVIADRPKWSKVRWVVVNGLSWEAIQPIASYYRLHPLAVEDMLDIPQRIKMDTFEDQTFCCFPLHILNVTPTPYSLLRRIARVLLVSLALTTAFFKHLFSQSRKKVVNFFKRTQRDKLPRFQERTGAPGGSVEDQSLDMNKIGKGSNTIKRLFSMGTSNESTASSEQTNVGDIFDYGDEESCIPFYTLEQGRLNGGIASSPVAKSIQEMTTRSIYEWNYGNISLKNEALQNMHIAGSTNSFEIAMEQVSLFIVDDVVITFFERSAPEIFGPLEVRLQSPMTFLRQTSDPIILVQAILDTSVDLVGLILNEYRTRLNNLQTVSIPRPTLHHTRGLHAFITDMTVLRPHLSSIYQLIEGLWPKLLLSRDNAQKKANSAARAQKFSDHYSGRKQRPSGTKNDDGLNDDGFNNDENDDNDDDSDEDFDFEDKHDKPKDVTEDAYNSESIPLRSPRAHGAASNAIGLYFGDVADHALRHLQDLDDMRNQSNTLSSLLFNTINIRAGDSVWLLSLVSVVFLPLTFLTGYFGMNFKSFSVLDNSVDYYWFVAAPATGALTVFLMYPSIMDWVQEALSWSRDQI